MEPGKLPPSSPQLNSNKQESSNQPIEKPEKAESSWIGAGVTKLLEAIGYIETGAGPESALADRKISSPGTGSPADTGTQCETSVTADPQPVMQPEEVLPALAEAVKAKDADQVKSLLALLKLSSPDQVAQITKDILKTVLQDNMTSILGLRPEKYEKLKNLIDCLLGYCGNDDTPLANSALKLFFDRKHFSHATRIKERYNANLEADHLKIALDKLVECAPYTELGKALEILARENTTPDERIKAYKTLNTKYPSDAGHTKPEYHPLHQTVKEILGLANLQDAQSLALARNTLADGLTECLKDNKWLRKLEDRKYLDLVEFFREFFRHDIKPIADKELAYSLVNICFTRGHYKQASEIADDLGVCLTDKHLAEALKDSFHQSSSVEKVLMLGTPGAAANEIIKDTIQELLKTKLKSAEDMEYEKVSNFRGFIVSYVRCLPGKASDKSFLINPLIEFCVRGNRIDLALILKSQFEGCHLDQKTHQEAVQKVNLSSIHKTEKTKRLNDLFDLAEHSDIKTD